MSTAAFLTHAQRYAEAPLDTLLHPWLYDEKLPPLP